MFRYFGSYGIAFGIITSALAKSEFQMMHYSSRDYANFFSRGVHCVMGNEQLCRKFCINYSGDAISQIILYEALILVIFCQILLFLMIFLIISILVGCVVIVKLNQHKCAKRCED